MFTESVDPTMTKLALEELAIEKQSLKQLTNTVKSTESSQRYTMNNPKRQQHTSNAANVILRVIHQRSVLARVPTVVYTTTEVRGVFTRILIKRSQ